MFTAFLPKFAILFITDFPLFAIPFTVATPFCFKVEKYFKEACLYSDKISFHFLLSFEVSFGVFLLFSQLSEKLFIFSVADIIFSFVLSILFLILSISFATPLPIFQPKKAIPIPFMTPSKELNLSANMSIPFIVLAAIFNKFSNVGNPTDAIHSKNVLPFPPKLSKNALPTFFKISTIKSNIAPNFENNFCIFSIEPLS